MIRGEGGCILKDGGGGVKKSFEGEENSHRVKKLGND